MFSLASGIYQSYFVPQQLSILLIGEEGTGKTTLLERIKVTQTSRRPLPTTATTARAILSCPVPKKYAPSLDQDEEVIEKEGSSRSLEEIPLNTPDENNHHEEEEIEYNVKPGARMLPLDKIRPTSTYGLRECILSC
jgi:ATPase subunit of ABC transporter with duplicated ATPase domains